MIIKNANIYTKDHEFKQGSILINEDRIDKLVFENVESISDSETIDAKGHYVIPGLVDIHFHGAKNCDTCDCSVESLKTIAEYEASQGVLAICPATMTIPVDELENVLSTASKFANTQKNEKEASLVGINLEGPFISPQKVGAQNSENIKAASIDLFTKLQAVANGLIKLVDLAPEEGDNLAFIKDLKEQYSNVHTSIAHSNCDYDIAKDAFDNGIDHLTHTWNAMNGINHRAPGPSIAGAEAHAYAELICDGIHIHPAMVRLAFKMFGDDRLCLISDSMRAAGMPDGEYDLGGQSVVVKGNKAVLKADENTIAGSVTNLYECMKKAVSFGIPFETAVRAASENPAKSIGLDQDYGVIDSGKFANLLIVDNDLNIVKIINKGVLI